MAVKPNAIRAVAHVRRAGADDVFVSPLFHPSVEEAFLRADREYRHQIVKAVNGFLIDNDVKNIAYNHRFQIPKSRFSFRPVSLMRLEDAAKFLALVLEEAGTIEAARPASIDGVVHSYRLRQHGFVFTPQSTFSRFKERSVELSTDPAFKVKVATDISNFYDRINLHRLESILASIGCNPRNIKKINEVLMVWAGRNSFGVPVGCDASRILAEASLINVDRELKRQGIVYTRYVDDFRMFASDYLQANQYLNILSEALNREGLFINNAKTFLMDINQEEPSDDFTTLREFDPIDMAEQHVVFKTVRVGYKSKLVKTYKKPGDEKVKEYRRVDLSKLKARILADVEANLDDMRIYVKGFIYQEEAAFSDLRDIISRHIQYTEYVVDALIVEKALLSNERREQALAHFSTLLEGRTCAEYYQLVAFRLCSEPGFNGLATCRQFIESSRVANSPIVLREAILRMSELGDRETLVQIREFYWNVSIIVKQAIFYCWLKSEKLLKGEKRAFFKTLHRTETDQLILRETRRFLHPKEK